jgi:hypothetical protein
VKDFIRSVAKKKKTHTKPGKVNGWLVGIIIIGLLSVLVWALVRSLRWSDLVGTTGQETTLFLTENVDQTGAYVVRFLFDDLSVEVYPIPADVLVEVAGGYSQYRFQAVYPLLLLEGKDQGYIRSAMSLTTGVLLDELWRVNLSELKLETQSQLQQLLFTGLLDNRQVVFSRKLAWLALLLDHRTEYVLQEPLTELPSGRFKELRFDFAQSSCTAAIINTTSFDGLAGRIADLLENQNYRVVRAISDTTQTEKTLVLVSDEAASDCAVVIGKLEKLVPGGVEQQTDSAETLRYRADVVVKLGEDLAQ